MLPKGFRVASVNAGVKSPAVTRLDMGLVYCDRDAVLAGVFTQNVVKAAPVLIGMQQVAVGSARAIVTNAGNANACTGEAGITDAKAVMSAVAQELDVSMDSVVPLSTGVIGVALPVERMCAKAHQLKDNLGVNLDAFAESILTTDTCIKVARRSCGDAKVVGVAKGSGMISPNMATTLAIVMTDAVVDKATLDNIVSESIMSTFNAITVDGDTSTNDTLLAMASGYVDCELDDLRCAIHSVIHDLAQMVVRDGEGATKLACIDVNGAATHDDAVKVAMSIAKSPLVKTALFGEDPNWGRILCAAGYSGAVFDPSDVIIRIGGLDVVVGGREAEGFSEEKVHEILTAHDVAIEVVLGSGPGSFRAWTTDFSYEYVKINAEYRT